MKNKKVLILLVLIILTVMAFYLYKKSAGPNSSPSAKQASSSAPISQSDKPTIVSTKPDPLDNTIISTTQVVEISFNRPLENVGEFKVRIEPEVEYKVELSSDRKTAKILPNKSFQLGTTYTLFIGTETKFDGVGRWGEEKIYHFRTIKYTGV